MLSLLFFFDFAVSDHQTSELEKEEKDDDDEEEKN